MIPDNYTPNNLDATHPPSIVELARRLALSMVMVRLEQSGVMSISPDFVRARVDESWRNYVRAALDALDFLARNGVQGSTFDSFLADAKVSRAAIKAENDAIGAEMW